MPIVDNPKLYEKAKKIADEKYSKPSAYKSGFIVKTYKEMGGTYTDDGKPKNLKRWYKERWTDVGNKDYPVLRPTVKVSKKTPLLPSEISNLTEQIQLKQKIKGKKNLPPFISHDISMKDKKGGMMPRRLEGELRAQEQLPEPSRERRPIYTRRQAMDFETKKAPVPPEIVGIAGLVHDILPELVHTIYISTTLHSVGWTEEDILFLAGNDIPAFKRLIIHLSKNPSEYLKSVGSGKKGGMPRRDKDIILPPTRVVTGDPVRPFEGQEVYADFPEARAVFSDFTLAEEQREIARAQRRDDANITSLYRQYGEMYPGGLAAAGAITAYNDFTDRFLPSRMMNESYVANLPVAERRRIIRAFLRQRQGMCVASGKSGAGLLDALYKREKKGKAVIDYPKLSGFKAESKKMLRLANLPAMTREERQERAEALSTTPERVQMLRGRLGSGKGKTSKWIEHVKAHAKTHGVSYKQAMKDSKHTYVG